MTPKSAFALGRLAGILTAAGSGILVIRLLRLPIGHRLPYWGEWLAACGFLLGAWLIERKAYRAGL